MKKIFNNKSRLFLLIILVIIIIISLFTVLFKNYQNNKIQERYEEIRDSAKKAVEWKLKANYPKCPIGNKYEKERSSHCNASYLISQGFIKKEELLDVDGISYCDVYVKIYTYFKNPLDYQNNCEVDYKIYLKCKDYVDKGYIDWGN